MSNVPASRVTRNEDVAKVGHVGQPRVGLLGDGLGLEPLDSREAVLNGSREAVFGSEAIVRRDNNSLEAESELEAVVLAVGPGA